MLVRLRWIVSIVLLPSFALAQEVQQPTTPTATSEAIDAPRSAAIEPAPAADTTAVNEPSAALDPASTDASPVTPRRHHRNRWSNTLSLGASVGGGSPLGVLGAFLEYRPIRWVSASIGAGFGGAFGPAVGGTLYIDPIVTRYVAFGVGGSLSTNFSYVKGEVVSGRQPLPANSNWASLEIEAHLRPTRHALVRVGVGYAFLLNTREFHIGSEAEIAQMRLPSVPFGSPIDAMRSAARDETFGVWFAHIDVAPVWRL